MKKKILILFCSCVLLWVGEVLLVNVLEPYGSIFFINPSFLLEISSLGWLPASLMFTIIKGFIGIFIGGFILFNIFLFFYNVFKPNNTLKVGILDKVIIGVWFIIATQIFKLFTGLF